MTVQVTAEAADSCEWGCCCCKAQAVLPVDGIASKVRWQKSQCSRSDPLRSFDADSAIVVHLCVQASAHSSGFAHHFAPITNIELPQPESAIFERQKSSVLRQNTPESGREKLPPYNAKTAAASHAAAGTGLGLPICARVRFEKHIHSCFAFC